MLKYDAIGHGIIFHYAASHSIMLSVKLTTVGFTILILTIEILS